MPSLSYPYLSVGEQMPSEGKPFSHDGVRNYKRKFLVRVADKRMGPVEVCQAPLLPLPYAPYVVDPARGESDLRALCIGIDAAPANQKPGEWGNWMVTHDYSTNLGSGQGLTSSGFPNDRGNGAENNPEFEPPDIEWDFQEMSRAFLTDLDGNAYLNSALRPLTPAPQIEIAYPVLTITRNELFFDRRRASKFAYALNGDFFLQTPPEGAQCLPPKAVMKFKGKLQYWRVTYKIRFAVELPDDTFMSWQPEFNDNGMEELLLKPGQRQIGNLPKFQEFDKYDWHPIKDLGGHKISAPVLLDGDGSKLKPDSNGKMVPVKLKFKAYRRQDFTELFVRGLGG